MVQYKHECDKLWPDTDASQVSLITFDIFKDDTDLLLTNGTTTNPWLKCLKVWYMILYQIKDFDLWVKMEH